MILKLICMIVLGILSGVLSYYNKNYYVRIFNDILGREEDEQTAARVGRGFFYGFLFPIYFVLLITGLFFLVVFLIAAGIIAAIVFVLVWISEKLLPNQAAGNVLIGLFEKVGLRAPAGPPAASQEISAPAQSDPAPASPPPSPAPAPSSTAEPEKKDSEEPKS